MDLTWTETELCSHERTTTTSDETGSKQSKILQIARQAKKYFYEMFIWINKKNFPAQNLITLYTIINKKKTKT